MIQSTTLLLIDPPPFGPPQFNPASSERHYARQSESPKIIVVDDETTIAETLVEILQGEGFEAMSASTGQAAVELARTFQPDLVLSDVIIPGLNGIEAGVKIREFLPECRIILFSGQAATLDLLKEARERGHEFEILAKPIKPEALLTIIRRDDRRSS
jgi:CheY-like chemotaxis protein